jgi:hypothetical protein
MEQKRKRSVLITVVSIIAISVSGFMIFWSLSAMLMTQVVMPAVGHGNDFRNNSGFGYFPLIAGVAGIAFLIASIGMLKRKNAFRIAFVTLLGLAGAGIIVLGLESVFRFGLMPHQDFRFSKNLPLLGAASSVIAILMCVSVVIAIVILIAAIMSKRASSDFRKRDE